MKRGHANRCDTNRTSNGYSESILGQRQSGALYDENGRITTVSGDYDDMARIDAALRAYAAEVSRLTTVRDELQAERDEARADAERVRVAMALSGTGIDPEGYYAGTPGSRVRELLAAETELARLRPAEGKGKRVSDTRDLRNSIVIEDLTPQEREAWVHAFDVAEQILLDMEARRAVLADREAEEYAPDPDTGSVSPETLTLIDAATGLPATMVRPVQFDIEDEPLDLEPIQKRYAAFAYRRVRVPHVTPLAAESADDVPKLLAEVARLIAQRGEDRFVVEGLRAALERAKAERDDEKRALALAEKHSLRDEQDMLRILARAERAEAKVAWARPVVEAAKRLCAVDIWSRHSAFLALRTAVNVYCRPLSEGEEASAQDQSD